MISTCLVKLTKTLAWDAMVLMTFSEAKANT